ncbi:TPA: hypothetical protein I9Y29_000675 [Citrobacter freundii]|uniref:Uncharacterized protein n=1 Tax=Citrobacter freundii TaxID=546 RepID=A0A8H9Q8K5_CITFR|nr:hypothetical protein [Citrobacter freundii]
MNEQGRLTAASLATQAPGGKIVAARFIRLMPSACRVGAEPAVNASSIFSRTGVIAATL